MKNKEQNSPYDTLIGRIRAARICTVAAAVLLAAIVVILAFPIHIEMFGRAVVDHDGINAFLAVLLVLLIAAVGYLAFRIASAPIGRALASECDPEKHLALCKGALKMRNLDSVCSGDLLLMGRFDEAMKHAEKMIKKNDAEKKLTGLYDKVRCLFHKDDFGTMRQCADEYAGALHAADKLSSKKREKYVEIEKAISLHTAIADGDKESIAALCESLRPWSRARDVRGYVDYLLGMAYYALDDKKECRYRMKSVKDKCEKTVFAALADKYM